MHERIVILSPTRQELIEFLATDYQSHGCHITEIAVSGVGMAETAAAVHAAIIKHSPSLIILTGIAGYYKSSDLEVGEVVLVERERIADLGAIHPSGFRPMYTKDYLCPLAETFHMFRQAKSNTVSTAAAAFIETGGAEIENMEGAALFAICTQARVPFLELRSISNPVSPDHKGWDIHLATTNLARELGRLLDEIATMKR